MLNTGRQLVTRYVAYGSPVCRPSLNAVRLRPEKLTPFEEAVIVPDPPVAMTTRTLRSLMMRTSVMPGAGTQTMRYKVHGQPIVRYSHTDNSVPSFDEVLLDKNKQRHTPKGQTHVAYAVGTVATTSGMLYFGKNLVNTLLDYLSPAADVLALSSIEVNLDDIPEGKNLTFKWRGKPLFIRRRTSEEVAKERAVDISTLRDPEADEARCKNENFLICLGVCTHLGCVPISHAGDWGGYYCPCHGSHYDASGRVRFGPAPANLEVPDHRYTEDGQSVIVG